MRIMIAISMATLALGLPAFSVAQTAAQSTMPDAAQSKMTLDTPLGEIAANAEAKAILDKHLPGLTTHAMWDAFKAMSLNQMAPMSNGQIPADRLKMVEADLTTLKK